MKYFTPFIMILILTSGKLFAQDNNQKMIDEKSGKEIFIGAVTREGLEKSEAWFQAEYSQYVPDSNDIRLIKTFENQYPWIFIVLGTWCGDSQEQVPRFFRILDELNYPEEKIFMVAVDREKKTKDFCIGDYDIKLVPTFIMTDQGEEKGRIIETPGESLEKDFLNIIRGYAPAPRD